MIRNILCAARDVGGLSRDQSDHDDLKLLLLIIMPLINPTTRLRVYKNKQTVQGKFREMLCHILLKSSSFT